MCEYCDHDCNEDAKRFPLFADRGKDEAFIDEDNYLSVYTHNGDWVGVGIKYCPMCGEKLKGELGIDVDAFKIDDYDPYALARNQPILPDDPA